MAEKILIFVFVVMLSGCATTYQSGGLTGGYYQVSGYGRLEKVIFSGNGFINSEKVTQYALYRCAEVAKEKKKPYFVIYENLLAASLGKSTKMPAVGAVGNKPTAYAFVLFLDESRPEALETEKILRELSDLVKNPQT